MEEFDCCEECGEVLVEDFNAEWCEECEEPVCFECLDNYHADCRKVVQNA